MLQTLRTHEAKGSYACQVNALLLNTASSQSFLLCCNICSVILIKPVLEEDRPMWFCKSIILDRPLSLAVLQLMGRAQVISRVLALPAKHNFLF